MTARPPGGKPPHGAISARIRTLAAAGHSRADIARMVDRSYQQVRQVLVADEARRRRRLADAGAAVSKAGMAEEARAFAFQNVPARLQVDDQGQLFLPPQWEVPTGAVFMARRFGGDIVLMDAGEAAERARMEPRSDSMVDALIAERRWEAAREYDD